MKKDTSVIPYGIYCYDENGFCLYWSKLDDLPEQYNGYCSYLEKSDLELSMDKTFINCKTGEICNSEDLPFPTSHLWDACKECGINDDI